MSEALTGLDVQAVLLEQTGERRIRVTFEYSDAAMATVLLTQHVATWLRDRLADSLRDAATLDPKVIS